MTHDLSTPQDITDAMEVLGMNQPRFGDAVGVDQATVSRWVNGKAKPSAPVRKLISRLLAEHTASQSEVAA
ncbi:helix-turn-helix domain-containing protein [Agrobacterium rhizogenes]|nr:helix-turn-helix domain-containing protein [Rhizobium rhizogenes]